LERIINPRKKISQTVYILADDEGQAKLYGSLKKYLDKYPIGTVLKGAMPFRHPEIEVTVPKLTAQIANYQLFSKTP